MRSLQLLLLRRYYAAYRIQQPACHYTCLLSRTPYARRLFGSGASVYANDLVRRAGFMSDRCDARSREERIA